MNAFRPLAVVAALALAGCATWQAPGELSDAPLRARALTATNQGVRVSAAVLSPEESRSMLGIDLNPAQMQAVWVEVQNQTPRQKWLLRSGTDPEYFSPLEVAWSAHRTFGGAANASIDEHLDRLGFKNPVPAGMTHAGILFTRPDRITKLFNLDLLGQKTLVPFTLFLPVPQNDAAADSRAARDAALRFPASQIADYTDLASLRAAIERLPCCTAARGTAQGDPLNVVLVGELEDIGAAVVRRNYRRQTHAADLDNQVFGRPPDAVLRKSQVHSQSAWIRAWRAPLSFEGRAVFLAQAGRPIGGRFVSPGTDETVTHEDANEARNLLVQDMMYSGGLDKLGFASGAGTREHSDGLRAVLFFSTRPLSLADVEILDWAPYLKQ